DTATTEIYTLSLHDALPIFSSKYGKCQSGSISATPSAEMNSVEMTFAITVIPSSQVVSVGRPAQHPKLIGRHRSVPAQAVPAELTRPPGALRIIPWNTGSRQAKPSASASMPKLHRDDDHMT